jgi:hypothetical protein
MFLGAVRCFLKDELTTSTNHIAVRAKFTTLTVGSFDIIGISCDLQQHGSQLERYVDIPTRR